MARLEFTSLAVAQLDQLIERHELPENTPGRVAASARHLSDFPDAGSPLPGDWDGFRFVLGPWPWMLLIYAKLEDDRVVVVSVEDSRTSGAVTNQPPDA